MFNDFPYELSAHITSFLRGHMGTLRSVALTCRDGRSVVNEIKQEEIQIYNALVQQLSVTADMEKWVVMNEALTAALANNHTYVICKVIDDYYTQPENPYRNMSVVREVIIYLVEAGLLDQAAKMRNLNPSEENFLVIRYFACPSADERNFNMWRFMFRLINQALAADKFSSNIEQIYYHEGKVCLSSTIAELIHTIRDQINTTLSIPGYQKYAPKLHDEFHQIVANILYKLYKNEWRIKTFHFFAKQLLAEQEKLVAHYSVDNPYPQILAKVKAMNKAPKTAAAAPSLKR